MNNKRIITILHTETDSEDVDKQWQLSNSNTKCCISQPLTHLLASWPYRQGQPVPSLPLHNKACQHQVLREVHSHPYKRNSLTSLWIFNNGQARKYWRTVRFTRWKHSKVQETTWNLERKSEHSSESTYSKNTYSVPFSPLSQAICTTCLSIALKPYQWGDWSS